MRESVITRRILQDLKEHGGWWVKIHGGPMQAAGIPDIVGCYKGRFVGIEVKVPGAKASLKQRLILKRIRHAGGVSAIVTSPLEALKVIGSIDSDDQADDSGTI